MMAVPMRRILLAAALLAASPEGEAEEPRIVRPFEAPPDGVPATPLDALVREAHRRRGVEAAPPCSDEVFVRRVFLDLLGTLPRPAEVRRFLEDRRPDRRAALVESLFDREEYADWWSLRWCDVLRVKSEFPVNLWPNAVQAYHRWVREAIRTNMPYDRFARELLTASGSNFRDPPSNFWRAVQGRDASSLAAAVALTFLGERAERWSGARRAGMALFFSRVAWKPTREWKEEIVLLDPAATGPLDAVLPDGERVTVPEGEDPRRAFADWLVAPDNPSFARAVVNRLWYWLLGRGVVHEPDDLRPDNPPTVPGLLEYLGRELVRSGWDLRHVQRLILASRTYQQSPIPRAPAAVAEEVFACYPVRRLDAEVLVDALCRIGGDGEGYTSTTPEPYSFVPAGQRTIALDDGSVTSPFLEEFGRPPRDTGLASERSNEPTDLQRLELLNSSAVRRRIEGSPAVRAAARDAARDPASAVRILFAAILSRRPVEREQAAAEAYLRGRSPREGVIDLAWALVNSKEFLYRH